METGLQMTVQDIVDRLKEDGQNCLVDRKKLDDYSQWIGDIYRRESHHVHSCIAEAVDKLDDPELIQSCLDILEDIRHYLVCDKTWDMECLEAVEYFIDYFEIEKFHCLKLLQLRVKQNQVKEEIDGLQTYVDTQKQELVDAHNDFEREMRDEIRSLDVHSVTVLGIFTAITFAFSGSFTLVGSALSEIEKVDFDSSFLLIAVVSLLCIGIYNTAQLLINGILRIWKKEDQALPREGSKLVNTVLALIFVASMIMFFAYSPKNEETSQTDISDQTIQQIVAATEAPTSVDLLDDNDQLPDMKVPDRKQISVISQLE